MWCECAGVCVYVCVSLSVCVRNVLCVSVRVAFSEGLDITEVIVAKHNQATGDYVPLQMRSSFR